MSPKAAIRHDARPTAFVWAAALDAPAAESAPRPSAAPGPAAAPSSDPSEHQARLAALERDAFAKGYAQGERAGAEAGARRSEAMLRRLGETLQEIGGLREKILRQSERQLVQLAFALARRVVRREIEGDDDFLAALARVALDRLGEHATATIHLHPEDLARTPARHLEEWSSAQVRVLPDPAVSRGGCRVESPYGFVDAGIDAQFEQLARALVDSDIPSFELRGA